MKIVSVGAGPAGLYAALLLKLADPRHEVVVHEREAEGTVRGWGVTFWDDLIEQMRRHDPESAAAVTAAATRWTGMEVHLQGRAPVVTPDFWGHSIARSALIRALTERARDLGVTITYESAVDADRLSGEADLVLAADGVNSAFRQAHATDLGARVDHGRNRFAWLATPKLFPDFRFAFAESDAGWLCSYAYAYSEDASTFVVELPPETFDRLGLADLDADATMATLQETFDWQLDGQSLLVQPNVDGTVPWRQFPTVRTTSWQLGNVAVLGDAVHTAHYSIGFGTKMALEDAMALADAVSADPDIPAALRRYQAERVREVRATQRDADYSRRWYERADRYLGLPAEEFAALLDRRRSPVVAHLPPTVLLSARRLVKSARRGKAR